MGNGNGQSIAPQPLPRGQGNCEKVTKEDRTSPCGKAFTLEKISKIVACRLANPTANQTLIGELTASSQATVNQALATPWAKRQLAYRDEGQLDVIRSHLATMAGNALTYVDHSILRGGTEIQAKRPEPSILLNAREASKLVLHGTGLLADTIKIQQAGKGLGDYTDDDDLVALQQVTAKVSRETPSSKG